jgi:hypothetical protein
VTVFIHFFFLRFKKSFEKSFEDHLNLPTFECCSVLYQHFWSSHYFRNFFPLTFEMCGEHSAILNYQNCLRHFHHEVCLVCINFGISAFVWFQVQLSFKKCPMWFVVENYWETILLLESLQTDQSVAELWTHVQEKSPEWKGLNDQNYLFSEN